MAKKIIVSGMRPTGSLHLGHLHGALKNWLGLQEEYDCYFFVADWHALTSEYENPQKISEATREILMDWVSVGLDPEKCTFFLQSKIKQHAELHLIFSMITPLPWLERNPTYKEMMANIKSRDLSTYGFLGYPVLQAADILIYKADGVPVGADQAAHVELTREIARRFNHFYGKIFPAPETLLTPTAKVPGIDGRKMSKSYGNAIFLVDSPEIIKSKVGQMITDPQRKRRNDPGDPSVCSVFALHELYSPMESIETIREDCKKANIGCVDCKNMLAERLIDSLGPIRKRREEIETESGYIEEMISLGNTKARKKAEETMQEVRKAIGIE